MFPIASLPNTAFAFRATTCRAQFNSFNGSRECRLDQPPPCGEVRIILRQSPDRVEMVRQYNDRLDRERMTRTHIAKGCSKQIDFVDKKPRSSVSQIDCEKESPAGNKITPIIGHRRMTEL